MLPPRFSFRRACIWHYSTFEFLILATTCVLPLVMELWFQDCPGSSYQNITRSDLGLFLIRGWGSDSQKRNRSTQICVFSKCLPGARHGMWCWECNNRLRHCRRPQGSHKEGRDAHDSLPKSQSASSLPLTPVCPCSAPPQQ